MTISRGAAAIALLVLASPAILTPAFAQTTVTLSAEAGATGVPTAGDDPRGGRDPSLSGTGGAARDGCVNVPGVPHNSADCSRLPANDPNTANAPSRDLAGRSTGATENAERNARILSGQSRN